MKTTNEKLLEDYIEHQDYIEKLAKKYSNELNGFLKDYNDDLLNMFKVLGKDATDGQIRRLVKQNRDTAWDEIKNKFFVYPLIFIKDEFKKLSDILIKNSPIILNEFTNVGSEKINVINKKTSFNKKNVFPKYLDNLAKKDITTTLSTLITNPKAPIINIKNMKTNFEGMLETGFTEVSNIIKKDLIELNKDVIKQEIFMATLDSRTTIQCVNYDGEIFSVGEGPRPPLHYNCRSIRSPTLDADIAAMRPANPSVENEILKDFYDDNNLDYPKKDFTYKKIPRGYKTKYQKYRSAKIRAMIGRVPHPTKYKNWYKNQSLNLQKEVFGAKRLQYLRDGDLKVSDLVDKNGNVILLKDLKTIHNL